MNVKINYITDGDIAGALSVVGENPKNDVYYSTGGAPEGVVVAAALSCYGGQIQGRLVLDEEEKVRAKKLGITDFNRKYNIDDMVKGDVIFCATGVTSGDLAKGVKDLGNEFEVNTFALHKNEKLLNQLQISIINENTFNKWKRLDFKKFDQNDIEYFKENFSLDEITSRLLSIRKIKKEDISSFLNPSIKNFYPIQIF